MLSGVDSNSQSGGDVTSNSLFFSSEGAVCLNIGTRTRIILQVQIGLIRANYCVFSKLASQVLDVTSIIELGD